MQIVDDTGKRFLVSRVFNPASSSPIAIRDIGDESAKDFQVAESFPVLFLSQNEIIRIAEDQTGGALRAFIDRFFDFYRFQNEIERLNRELSEIDDR